MAATCGGRDVAVAAVSAAERADVAKPTTRRRPAVERGSVTSWETDGGEVE